MPAKTHGKPRHTGFGGRPKANPRQTQGKPTRQTQKKANPDPWKTQTHRFWGAAEGKPKANPRQTHKANPEEGKPRHTDFFTPAVGDACGGTDLTVGRERGRLFQETG
jgi:hypothetical protein